MISIKRFLSTNPGDHGMLHVLHLLVDGIGQHTIAGDPADIARFRQSVKEVSDALVAGIAPEDLLVRAGALLQGLGDHNRRALRRQQLQDAELQSMVKMLAYTVGVVSAVGNTNVDRLGEIEKQVAVVKELDDIRSIKAKLSDCLADIRKEAQRQRQEIGETIQQLNHGLSQALKRSANGFGESPDPLTALPGRSEAEAAFAEAGSAESQAYAAVMVLDRLQVLNQRFGREVGDEILVSFVQFIKKQLSSGDTLFRWGGPAFVALLPRTASLDRVRSELGRIMETKLEHTIETASRSVLVPVAARWTLFPMMAAPRLIYQKIDAFITIPTQRE